MTTKKGPRLLERALAHVDKREERIGDEQIELAFAWLRDEVTTQQAIAAFRTNGGSVYGLLARSLRKAYRTGKLAETVAA